jgi:hypothetical protein
LWPLPGVKSLFTWSPASLQFSFMIPFAVVPMLTASAVRCAICGGRSVGIVRSRTKATEFSLSFSLCTNGKFYLLGYSAVYSVESQPTFRRNRSLPFSRCRLHLDLQRIARRYVAEYRTLHNHRCENLRSYIPYVPVLRSRRCTDMR